jgi:hypothetical protein
VKYPLVSVRLSPVHAAIIVVAIMKVAASAAALYFVLVFSTD